MATINDKQTLFEYLQKQKGSLVDDPESFRPIAPHLLEDRLKLLEAIQCNGYALQYGCEELKGNRQFVLQAVQADGRALYATTEELKNDKEVVTLAVKSTGSAFKYASLELQGDKAIAMEAIRRDVCMFQYSTDALKGDKEFVLLALDTLDAESFYPPYADYVAVGLYEDIMEHVGDHLRSDREIMLKVCEFDYAGLELAHQQLKENKSFVLEVVKRHGRSLKFTSEQLRNDREVVKVAVEALGDALKYASKLCQYDKELILLAVKNHDDNWLPCEEYGDEIELWDVILNAFLSQDFDKEFMMQVLQSYDTILDRLNEYAENDPDKWARLRDCLSN